MPSFDMACRSFWSSELSSDSWFCSNFSLLIFLTYSLMTVSSQLIKILLVSICTTIKPSSLSILTREDVREDMSRWGYP